MNPLLNVDVALKNILADMKTLEAETVSLPDSYDRVLAEDIVSPIDLPPFDNSAMDGYALRYEDSAGASPPMPATLAVTMDIMAGGAPDGRLEAGQAARIMTGAPIPKGASAVIPVEDTDDDWSKGENSPLPAEVRLFKRLTRGENIRLAGENIKTGETILTAGTVIGAAEIGMIAGIGRPRVAVIRQPKVVILSSGDELVDIYDELGPGKIRDTNGYTLAGLIRDAGGLPIRLPIAKDSLASIRALYRRALDINPDLIISTAGVSVGAADLVRVVMDELGEIDFWRINMRPGKPLAYGTICGVPFFGLPGNPVSTMVTFEVLVRPALAKIAGRSVAQRTIKATITDDIRSDGRRTYARVTVRREGDCFVARSTGIQSSGALMSMVLADGLAIIPEDQTLVPAGGELEVLLLRGIE
ncbi:MAG: molybdopterin molybdotransferase MoeA [Chloroflexota bacterium]|nr:molybdopterin molybdotransferase MoeA [Chloroflexota bacterium]MDE2908029.1 molybdopterin molybdotransferase MoeA [Chloroflexota bacterium]